MKAALPSPRWTPPDVRLTRAQQDVLDWLLQNQPEHSFTAYEISRSVSRSRSTVSRALDALHDAGFLSARTKSNPAGGYATYYVIRRQAYADEAVTPIATENDSNVVVVINTNSPGAQTTIATLGKLRDVIQSSNAYAENEPEERAQTLAELEG